MECWKNEVDLSRLVVQCSSLVSVLEGCLGPHGKAILMEKAGCVIITKDGTELLSNLEVCDPLVSMLVKGVVDHTRVLGDGCKVTLLLLHRLLASLEMHVPAGASVTQGTRRQKLIQTIQQIRKYVFNRIQRDVMKYGTQAFPLRNFEVFSQVLHSAAADFFMTKFPKLIAKNLAKLFSTYISCECSSSKELVQLLKNLAIKAHNAVVEIYHMPLMMSYVLNGFVVTRNFRYLHKNMKMDSVHFVWWSIELEEVREEGSAPDTIETSLRETLVGGILTRRNLVEQSLACLSSMGTEVVFSSLSFPDWTVSLCAKYGISLVDSVDTEEQNFVMKTLQVFPVMDERDVLPESLGIIERIELLHHGTCKFILLAGLGVHQIVLCGPTSAQCRQFSASYLKLFRHLSSWVSDCIHFSENADTDSHNLAGCRDTFTPPFSPNDTPGCKLSLSSPVSPGPGPVAVFLTVPHGGFLEMLAKYLTLENISGELKNSTTKSVLVNVLNELPWLLYRKTRLSQKSYVEFQTRMFSHFSKLRNNQNIIMPEALRDKFIGYQNPFLFFKLLQCVFHFAEYVLRIECIVPANQRISKFIKNSDSDSDSD